MQRIRLVPILLSLIAVSYIGIMFFLPFLVMIVEASSKGWEAFLNVMTHEDTIDAFELTAHIALIVVPLNIIFGLAAAWAVSKYHFPGKYLLLTLIELPLSISPIITGLLYVLALGATSAVGGWLDNKGYPIIFAFPGLVLVTFFVTMPYIAHTLIPYMAKQGRTQEEAALSLGANGWQCFWYISLPNIKWSLTYGILLTCARSIGEFGAVAVVSGHIKGLTSTAALHIELLYNEYHYHAAFAVALVTCGFALLALGVKLILERNSAVALNRH